MNAGPVALDVMDHCDIETSSESYASRFQGSIGTWMLGIQQRAMMRLLGSLPAGAAVLDLGGGHGQLTGALLQKGWRVVIAGSDPACQERVAPYLSAKCRFDVVNLERLPYDDRCFDAVICVRLLAHAEHWSGIIGEMCRVARSSVVVDYPSYRSSNILAKSMFGLKQQAERRRLRPRHFRVFHQREIVMTFLQNHFEVTQTYRQFVWPMFVHRALGRPTISSLLEAPARAVGLTRFIGSPVLARADRDLGEVALHGSVKLPA